MDDKRQAFLDALENFVAEVQGLKQFKGKARVLKSLERIRNLKCFQED